MVKTKFEDIEAIKSELLIPNDKKWWTLRPDLSKPTSSAAVISDVVKLRKEAEHLIEVERKKYVAYKQLANKSDYNWINSVLTGGTFNDRLSANTLLIQDSPVHNLFSLHKLIDIVNSKGIRECLMSMDNLKDLFIGDLLLKERKMRPFMELMAYLPPKEGPLRTKLLILFYFEDQLLVEYRRYLEIVAKHSMEGNDTVKSKAVNVMWELLCERPEQEAFLLEKLVNKLGDPVAKRASQVVKLLGKLVNQKHPKMKEIVVKEVELLLFRQHIPELAQFYGLCFLSQILLDSRDKELATRMVNVYFNFFDSSTKKTNKDVKNRLMNVLITGLSRASPYATMEADLLEKRLESFYKVIHLVNQNTSVQGMVLIFNLIDSKDSGLISDRLYTLIYRSLLEINMETCTRRALYLNLLFKAMKRDSMPLRVKAFVKRLLQIALHQPPSIVCAIMVLLSSLIKSKPELFATFKPTKAATILNEQDEDEHYEDVELDEEEEEKIISKDKSRKGKKDSKVKKDKKKDLKKEVTKEGKDDSKQSTAWVHTKNLKKDRQISGEYDLMARNPLYANTQFSVNWELTLLRNHFHPSANMFAVKTINGESIDYDGDPLQDFTLKRFMDRFVFRNPKQINKSQAAQSSKSTLFARLDGNKSTPIQELANAARTNVPLEEQFIYDYLVQKKKETEDMDQGDDNESVASEDFERLLLKFEPDFDKDDDAFMKVKKSKRRGDDDDESGTDDSEGMFSDDDDFEIDSDDDYYKQAFDGVDQDIADAQYDDKTTFLSDDDDEDIEEIGEDGDDESDEENMETSRFKRRGRDKNLVNLFAAADKFSHLLEGKESDDEKPIGSDDDDDGDGGRRRGKRKPGKRSNNQKGKVYRQKKRR